MNKISVGVVLLLALVGFALQPTKGRPIPVDLAPLRTMPSVLGPFHAITNNDTELISGVSTTDGMTGLDRIYLDDAGRKVEIAVVPQTIGQHVPLMCDRYGGYTVLSETQSTLPGADVHFNTLTVRGDADHVITTCLYFWKTADGVFTPRPNRSLGLIAARWSDHQQGLFVNVCSDGDDIATPGINQARVALLGASLPHVQRLFSEVFRNPPKD